MNKSRYLSFIFANLFLIFSFTAFAEMTGPKDPGGGPELGDPPLGGGAPVGSGVTVLVILGIAYGGKKVYELRKKKSNDGLN